MGDPFPIVSLLVSQFFYWGNLERDTHTLRDIFVPVGSVCCVSLNPPIEKVHHGTSISPHKQQQLSLSSGTITSWLRHSLSVYVSLSLQGLVYRSVYLSSLPSLLSVSGHLLQQMRVFSFCLFASQMDNSFRMWRQKWDILSLAVFTDSYWHCISVCWRCNVLLWGYECLGHFVL